MGEPLKMWPELNNLTQIVECLQLYGNPGYVVSPSFTNSPMGGNSDNSIILHHEGKSPIHPAHGYHLHIYVVAGSNLDEWLFHKITINCPFFTKQSGAKKSSSP